MNADPAFSGTDELVSGDYLRRQVANTKGKLDGLFIARRVADAARSLRESLGGARLLHGHPLL